MIKDLIQLRTDKISTKDVVCINGLYFEAKRLRQYLKACKDLEFIRVYTDGDGLYINHLRGGAVFRSVAVVGWCDTTAVWQCHDKKRRVVGNVTGEEMYFPVLNTGKIHNYTLSDNGIF